jgi:hypothetical protein
MPCRTAVAAEADIVLVSAELLRSSPGLQESSGWRRWRSSATGSSRWEPRGYVATSPAPPMSAGFIVMTDPEGNEFCLD